MYNAIGKQAQTIDAQDHVTSYDYDALGHLVKTTYTDGFSESSTYDAEGRRIESIDRAGRKTTYSYDKLGRLIQTTYPDATTSRTQYDEVGQVKASIDALGHVTRYQYDKAGRRTKVIDASNSGDNPDCATAGVTCFAYDEAGNQKTITDANGHVTEFVYDNGNRRTEVKYPDGTRDQTRYDKLGRNISKTDQAGLTTQFGYDQLGRLTKVTDALGQITTYGYDEVGNQLSQTDANSHTTLFAYDKMGRRNKRTLPENQVEEMEYDISGNLISKTDFNKKTTTFEYDELNRLTQKTPDASLNEPPVLFSYTDSGQRAIMEDASGKTTYSYDNRDRLEKKITPQGILSYSYNGAGLLEVIQSDAADGVHLQYQYDALNRLTSVIDHNQGATQTVYGYDAVGNLASYQYTNGVEHRYSYNNLNRLENLQVGKGAVNLASYAYTLGPSGNRLSVAELSGRSVNYDYDALYRLKQENISGSASHNGQIDYTYDPVGNRLNRTSTVAGVADQVFNYNANDQIVSDTEKYDDNGNTTESDGQSYQYDSDNRLTDMNGGTVKVVYDGDGNRVSKTVAGVTTEYLVDNLNPTGYAQVLEERSNDQVTVVYGYGLDLISQNRKSGSTWKASYYGYDGHGSVRFLTDASGNVTDTYDYDAFGILLGHTGNTVNSYLYSGEQRDSSLGLDYLRARYYQSNQGKFATLDLWSGGNRFPLSLNKYIYATANPVMMIDTSGMVIIPDMGDDRLLTGYPGSIGHLFKAILKRPAWNQEYAIWNDSHISNFRLYVFREAIKLSGGDSCGLSVDLSCSQTAITLLINYAFENKLPVVLIGINNEVLDSRATLFKNKESFLQRARSRVPVHEVYNHNTFEKGEIPTAINIAQAGDLLMHDALVLPTLWGGYRLIYGHTRVFLGMTPPDKITYIAGSLSDGLPTEVGVYEKSINEILDTNSLRWWNDSVFGR